MHTNFKGLFLIKIAKKMCICEYIILVLILVENVFIGLKKGISKKMHWIAAKHIACIHIV